MEVGVLVGMAVKVSWIDWLVEVAKMLEIAVLVRSTIEILVFVGDGERVPVLVTVGVEVSDPVTVTLGVGV
jgi:hypothetical protein